MRCLRNSLLILFTLISHQSGFAGGNEVGNGGRAIVCKAKDQVELLDFYEAKGLRGAVPDAKITSTDPYEIVEQRLGFLASVDPKTAKTLTTLFHEIKVDAHFENDIQIQTIDDSEHPFVPYDSDCHVRQLAILRKNPLPDEKRVLVDNSLWKKMPPVQQAGLLLHETIYEHLAFLGEHDSIKARYLVSYLMSSAGNPIEPKSYWDMIKKMRLPIYH